MKACVVRHLFATVHGVVELVEIPNSFGHWYLRFVWNLMLETYDFKKSVDVYDYSYKHKTKK